MANIFTRYFTKQRYLKKTKDFFDPVIRDSASIVDLQKIVAGQIRNPNFVEGNDYPFMLVGVSENSSLNSWAGREWGTNHHEVAQENSEWYARISCNAESYVLFPKQLYVHFFNPGSNHHRDKKFNSSSDLNMCLSDNFHLVNADKSLKTLVSDVHADELFRLIKNSYQPHFFI